MDAIVSSIKQAINELMPKKEEVQSQEIKKETTITKFTNKKITVNEVIEKLFS
jgi:hypothetical protein